MNERQIFEAALDIADSARRELFLSQSCGDDFALRARVDALLAAHSTTSQFLETPAVEQLSTQPDSGPDTTLQLPSGPAAEGDSDPEIPNGPDLSFLSPSTKPGSIGMLGHYEILNVLGQGAFGIVFRAFDEKLHRHVAIKTMSVSMAATSPPRKRFLREARAAAQIRHDNVTQVYSVEEEPLPYLVMEFIDGQTLQQKQKAVGPLEVPELLHIGRQIAAGLAAAHAQSLIHRDVKPGNILLEQGAEQKVKITDFGLARAADDASLTRSGMISGTPLYMSPEQALGQSLDARSDLFSLGSVLYELATGRPPFRAPSTVAVLRRVVDDTPRPIQELIPETPDWLVAIIDKLLAKNPDDRYQSAKEVADLLARCQSELQLTGQVTCVPGAGSVSARSTPKEPAEVTQRPMSLEEMKLAAQIAKFEKMTPDELRRARMRKRIIAAVSMLCLMFPILYGRHLSRMVSSWFWPAIPVLPAAELTAGLRFDGKDDFIEVPVQWDTPVFTIEAFVTSEEGVPSGTLLHLSNEKRAGIESIELFDEQNQANQPQSFAGVVGGKSQGYLAAPLQRGVRQHRVLTFDGDHLHYYVNGMWQAKRHVLPEDQLIWKLRQLTIGCKQDRTNFFAGVIDQLRVSKVVRYKNNFAPITSVSSDDSTLAFYDFDEGTGDVLHDSSGNGADGKILGATWVHPAKGLQFDGVDDYVDFENLAWSSNQYTFETWITPLAEHGTLFQIAVPEGNLHAYLYEGGSGSGLNRDKPYTNVNGPRSGNKRQHLATVFDGKNLSYFINGKLAGSKTNVSDLTTPWTFQRLRIGSKLDPDASKPEFFHGRMEQFRVSNKALYVLPFTPEERLQSTADTLALYNFDENQGEVLKDASGHGPDGKIVGATWIDRSRIRQNSADSSHDDRSLTTSATGETPIGWHGWPADAPKPAIAPFTAEQARKHQEEWAAYLKVPIEYTNSIGMKFRLIPPGEFLMGSTQNEIEVALKVDVQDTFFIESILSEGPQRRVILTQPIYVGVHEVTQADYELVIGKNPSNFAPLGLGQEAVSGMDTKRFPVEMVTWYDAAEFCSRLSTLDHLSPFYTRTGESITPLDGIGYRLPSEAEWEFACRAGTTTKYWIGNDDDDLNQAGWYGFGGNYSGRTHVVGELKSNPFGLFDQIGNVWEWVDNTTGSPSHIEEPSQGIANGNRKAAIIRGGNLESPASHLRSSHRFKTSFVHKHRGVGFRAVLTVEGVRAARTAENAVSASTSATGWHGWPADAPKPAIAPFTAEQAKQHQQAWADYLKVPVEHTNSIGMKFRLIPPGEFTMGSTPDEIAAGLKDVDPNDKNWLECIQSEAPQHKVTLTQPIYLGVNEVTQAEYEKVMGVNPSHFAPMGMGKEAVAGLETTEHPVEMVSWNDAAEFCAKLSKQEKLKLFYFRASETITPLDGTGYRLPSEAEWEFACRAGTETKYWIGDEDEVLINAGWFGGNSGDRTHAAGELKANPFGLYDIHGNTWEWVQDGWDATYYGQFAEKPALNPNSPFSNRSQRVIRGGNWFGPASLCRSSDRLANVPTFRFNLLGFRVSLSVDAVRQAVKNAPASTEANSSWHGWPADAPRPAIAPFTAEQARKHQQAWADYLKVPVEHTNSLGMKFRLIPPGEFLMGSTEAEVEAAIKGVGLEKGWHDCIKTEMPRHVVILTQPVFFGAYEVTQGQYEKVMGSNPSQFSPTGTCKELVAGMTTTENPVECVTWKDAAEFSIKLSTLEKMSPSYFQVGDVIVEQDGSGYRLPCEAEWEFACRAGTESKYWSGSNDEDLVRAGYFGGNSGGRTHAVGELLANPFGLYDLHGNVWEWMQDGWDADSYRQYQEKPAVNPNSPFSRCPERVLRGSCWLDFASGSRSSGRLSQPAIARINRIGFRVALSVDAVNKFDEVSGDVLHDRSGNGHDGKIIGATRVKASGLREPDGAANMPPVTPTPEGLLSSLPGNPFAADSVWSAPVNLGPTINTSRRESNPSVTSDELMIVFTRGDQLLQARRASRDEPFSPAESVPGIPSPLNGQVAGCLAGDGLQLVYTSIAEGESKQDIFLATRPNRDEPFGTPKRLPDPINSPAEDRYPALSPDGLMLSLFTMRSAQKPGAALIFTRTARDLPFNPTPTVDPHLQSAWNVVSCFSSDGRGMLKSSRIDDKEVITWHTRSSEANTWSEGQLLPAPFDTIQFGAPFLSADGNSIYIHSRDLPEGQGELDLWVSRRTPKIP